ncbi:AAA family ATPase [Bacteroides cellulosilyticus]|uniref:AAA family ATPase n=1 Tax=Bacteroides cellulosilyticus TaxID=246787 RepID=UPI001C376060|nr:ATP-binding protein [Bacteroides cellulosilyticus]MBV3635301.1 ATP-binding protein [Bacteroides cellulosilyticus]MBV3661572.1 ATP-binding protein [Bacteroides cellulosilyticus]MBV3683621.1 ATP-binding protein [Bacteroides cellulosilyticus]MBV3691890.1 ATP-binding protein [Bacteroides cellulosilyticus]MBV3705727.1 ATP-binding protein [Bacteroides cellulosilyticus]
MEKPFVFGVATSGENFTDREKETERLLLNFTHGVNTILISPRRWGKTSLVKKVAQMAQTAKRKVVYMDIFSCRTEQEFYRLWTTSVLKQTSSKWDEWIENAKLFLSHINPKISIGTDPMNDFSINFEYVRGDSFETDILQLPEKIAREKDIQIVICIDEFQQISDFEDSKTFQKKLRTVWQLQQHVSYCLFGSKKHLMNELFERRNLPFYKFGDAIYLTKIETKYWVEYICRRFADTGKHISSGLAEEICRLVDNHSSYVQQLSWLLWIHTAGAATDTQLSAALEDLLDQNNILFQNEIESLSSYQMNFLRAIIDGVDSGFSRKEVLQKYNLGTSANIIRLKNALLQKELIEIDGLRVTLSDPVFGVWFKKRVCIPPA